MLNSFGQLSDLVAVGITEPFNDRDDRIIFLKGAVLRGRVLLSVAAAGRLQAWLAEILPKLKTKEKVDPRHLPVVPFDLDAGLAGEQHGPEVGHAGQIVEDHAVAQDRMQLWQLWILEENRADNDGKIAMVVRAPTSNRARELAAGFLQRPIWLAPQRSSCVEIDLGGPAEIILSVSEAEPW